MGRGFKPPVTYPIRISFEYAPRQIITTQQNSYDLARMTPFLRYDAATAFWSNLAGATYCTVEYLHRYWIVTLACNSCREALKESWHFWDEFSQSFSFLFLQYKVVIKLLQDGLWRWIRCHLKAENATFYKYWKQEKLLLKLLQTLYWTVAGSQISMTIWPMTLTSIAYMLHFTWILH